MKGYRTVDRKLNVFRPRDLVIIGALATMLGCSTPPDSDLRTQASPFVGAWLITETTKTTPDSSWTNLSPQTGLYLFTERHFSNMLIDGSEPRQPFSSGTTPEQRLAAYDPFIADAGTYEFDDSVLTTRNIIAKVPNYMNGGIIYRYRLNGDTLTLTLNSAWAPPDGELTYRLVRIAADER